ncbi:MAG: flagellar FlbD family protein [Phycisphaerales bacterium]
MITVTRLNGKRFVLNAELIRTVEENPDTVVTLITGDHIVVQESMAEIVRLTVEYGRLLRQAVPVDLHPGSGSPPSAGPAPRPTRARKPRSSRGPPGPILPSAGRCPRWVARWRGRRWISEPSWDWWSPSSRCRWRSCWAAATPPRSSTSPRSSSSSAGPSGRS